ncbi:hypothetical protein TGAM01_v207887 [Trichoderma gamsii]|uniref:Uncharacterized protein n=1 Tax=Trichoderma gamsii TaxID=398673 RepID=A0A2P4ZGE0_9HYPO|nr:hypothetical protein TGAM01_v207887 [Trichoderma gamsii]PON23360.1 hypothetical protein TGAM01_v207887 [Trichoderma gamsii]
MTASRQLDTKSRLQLTSLLDAATPLKLAPPNPDLPNAARTFVSVVSARQRALLIDPPRHALPVRRWDLASS